MPSISPPFRSLQRRHPPTLFLYSSVTTALTALRSFSSSSSSSSSSTTSVAGCRDGGCVGVALYFRRARLIDSLRVRLRSAAPFPLPSSYLAALADPFVALHALRSAPSPDSALSLFRSLPSFPSVITTPVVHALAKRLALAGRLPDLRSLLDDLDAGSFPSALPPSSLDRLRWAAAAGDVSSALHVWSTIRLSAAGATNASLGPRRGHHHPCTESYNLIMGVHVAAGDDLSAVATFSQMIQEGANPNSRTYTIVLDHLVRSGHLEAAAEIFYLLPSMRIPHTSKQYNVLAKAYSSTGNFEDLRLLVKEMNFDGILPGGAMREAIAKMRVAGHVEGTEEFVKELSPNDRIGYTLGRREEDASEEEGGEEDCPEDNVSGEQVQLKPWLDPLALAKSLEDWEASQVAELEAAKLVWTPRLVCKILRVFKKAETAWQFFCWVAYQPGGFLHDGRTVSRMIAILARNGHVELVERLFAKVKAEAIQLPLATVRLVIDFYGLSKQADAAVKVFREVDSICGSISRRQFLLLYSSLLRTMVKCRRGNEAIELLEEMIIEGILPDIQIFSGLMQYYAGIGDLKSIHKLFGMVRLCKLEPDVYMYVVLIQAYCKQERAALALRLFDEMRSLGLVPDRATKTLLVRSLWKEGKLREAATVEERCEEIVRGLPQASPGHAWTVSAADFNRIYDAYSGCFAEISREERFNSL